MRNVQQAITKAIINGQTLMTYKTKPQVGRKSVTVGRYQQAVGPRRFAVIIGPDASVCYTALEAAQLFIEYVGRNDAWNALQGRGRERNPQ
jgi:hypothetical protein